MPALVVAWLAGVCLLFARLAAGLWRVRALRRAGRALPPSPWQAACDRLGHRLGLRRAVRVADASFVDGPVVIGWLRPVVLLPIAAVAGLTPSQVEAILAHELAHVRRHDAVVNACQTVAETLLFYHPAVWWLSSRVRAEREHCCDDIALEMSGDPLAYAEALAELESWRVGSVPLAMAATGGPLLSRVARVLGRPPRPARIGAATTAALVLSFVVAAGALQISRRPSAGGGGSGRRARRRRRERGGCCSIIRPDRWSIRGFTARDLVRYAYQLPLSRIVGGPAWLDTDAFELTTTLDHVPAADETPALVRSLLEERFGLAVHESTIKVPVLALEIARPDGALGPNLQPATGECFDQRAWVAAGAPRLSHGQGERTRFCGVWDSGIDYQRAQSVSMDDLAASMRQRFEPAIRLDVVNRTGLPGVFDVSLEFFRPAAALMAVTPSLRLPLQAAGFQSVPEALEEQLGLKLVPATADAPAIVIDRIEMPTPLRARNTPKTRRRAPAARQPNASRRCLMVRCRPAGSEPSLVTFVTTVADRCRRRVRAETRFRMRALLLAAMVFTAAVLVPGRALQLGRDWRLDASSAAPPAAPTAGTCPPARRSPSRWRQSSRTSRERTSSVSACFPAAALPPRTCRCASCSVSRSKCSHSRSRGCRRGPTRTGSTSRPRPRVRLHPTQPGQAGPIQFMMRTLLAERFGLVYHEETREMPISVLVLARPDGKLGPKLEKSTTDCQAMFAARRGGGPPPGRRRRSARSCSAASASGRAPSRAARRR